MSNDYRLTSGLVGLAVGALLVAPVIPLAANPVASADDVTGPTPYHIPFVGTDTVTIDHTTGASDNFVQTDFGDFDYYSNPSTHFSEAVITFYPDFQEVIEDNKGAIAVEPLRANPATFISDTRALVP